MIIIHAMETLPRLVEPVKRAITPVDHAQIGL